MEEKRFKKGRNFFYLLVKESTFKILFSLFIHMFELPKGRHLITSSTCSYKSTSKQMYFSLNWLRVRSCMFVCPSSLEPTTIFNWLWYDILQSLFTELIRDRLLKIFSVKIFLVHCLHSNTVLLIQQAHLPHFHYVQH